MQHDRFKVDIAASQLAPVAEVVARAQGVFNGMLREVTRSGGITREHYVRYLSFQYHLTRGVQKAFLSVAAHASLSARRPLREFLFNFALEEEPHFSIAERDLQLLGTIPLECPLDVKLWWAYFTELIPSRPFIRLGATCVLENLGAGGGDVAKQLLETAPFITPDNSRFIQIHFHEALPHGDQIYHALTSISLQDGEVRDLRQGAIEGSIMYLRMAAWALRGDELQAAFDSFLEHPL